MYHAVEPIGLTTRLRGLWRWRHLAFIVRRHRSLRRHLVLRVFWQPAHAWLLLGTTGLVLARRRPLAAGLAAGWLVSRFPSYGPDLRGHVRAAGELPSLAVVDAAEVAALAWGSVEHRTLML
jgi:hypothetical protein